MMMNWPKTSRRHQSGGGETVVDGAGMTVAADIGDVAVDTSAVAVGGCWYCYCCYC